MPPQTASGRPASDRARETRERLRASGRVAFAAKGLAGTNLRVDILEPAGVSVGSFYHQFSDKTELLLDILSQHADAFRAHLRAVQRPRPGRSLEQLVRDAYELVFADVERHADILRIQLRERHSGSERVRAFLRADRERWIASLSEDIALIREASGLPPTAEEGGAELIVALAHGAIARLLETPEEARAATRARLVENLVRFSIGGMAALLEPGASLPEAARPEAEAAPTRRPDTAR